MGCDKWIPCTDKEEHSLVVTQIAALNFHAPDPACMSIVYTRYEVLCPAYRCPPKKHMYPSEFIVILFPKTSKCGILICYTHVMAYLELIGPPE
jgi:hypothetical protein